MTTGTEPVAEERPMSSTGQRLTEAMELLRQTTFDDGAISAAEWEKRYNALKALPPADEAQAVRKGLSMEMPSGARVAGWVLDSGGFEWIFISENGVKTIIRLSLDATCAMSEIAARLLDPSSKEAA